jgi:DNA-binding NtrC family response regulator
MSERYVLCVDDEPLLLDGLERTLRESFEVVTETRPLTALTLLERKELDFVAIVSDMRMPLMDGAKFLSCAAQIAPDAARLLLSGDGDLNLALATVSAARIARILRKPCAPSELLAALEAAVAEHRPQRSGK